MTTAGAGVSLTGVGDKTTPSLGGKAVNAATSAGGRSAGSGGRGAILAASRAADACSRSPPNMSGVSQEARLMGGFAIDALRKGEGGGNCLAVSDVVESLPSSANTSLSPGSEN